MSECRDCEAYVEELCELRARLAEAEAALRAVLAVNKATPGRKDCHIWADMLECARAYFAPDSAPAAHQHTDGCWEPDSGCDMGRNEKYVKVAPDSAPAARENERE